MKVSSTLFLRLALIGMATFILFICVLLFPAFLHEDLRDFRPLVAGLYVAALPFFYTLTRAWVLLKLIDHKRAFSKEAVIQLSYIKNSATIITVLFIAYLPIFMERAQHDDAPGIFAIGLMIAGISMVIAVFSALLQKLFQSAVDIKSENDLTV